MGKNLAPHSAAAANQLPQRNQSTVFVQQFVTVDGSSYYSLHTVCHCNLTLLQKTFQHLLTLTVLFKVQDSKIFFSISRLKVVIMVVWNKESVKKRIEKVADGS